MGRLSIQLPDDLQALAQARSAETGHTSVESYVEALIRADATAGTSDHGAPDHLTFGTDEALEAMLVQRLDDDRPSIEATPEFWRDLKRRAGVQSNGLEGE